MSELCRREGIRPSVYYAWLVEVEGLKRENGRLRQLAAELSLGGAGAQKTSVPEFD